MKISRDIMLRVVGVLCLVVVTLFCVGVIYDTYSPWPVAAQELERFGKHNHLCIGLNWESSTMSTDDHTKMETKKQRAFVLMRTPVAWPRVVTVSQDQDGRVTMDESFLGFWFWLAVICGSFFGGWRLLIRPLFERRQLADKITGTNAGGAAR